MLLNCIKLFYNYLDDIPEMRDVHPGMKIQFPMHPNGVLPPSQKKTNPGFRAQCLTVRFI